MPLSSRFPSVLSWSALAAVALGVTSSGCDAILGIHDVEPDPTGGGGTGASTTSDGGSGAGTSTGGGGTGGFTGAPDFAFGLKTAKVTLPLGGSAFVAFEIVPKNGFADPVTVELEITPNGVSFSDVTIDAGQTTGKGQLGYTGLLMINETLPLTFIARSGKIEHKVEVTGTVTGKPGNLVEGFGVAGITTWNGAMDGASVVDVREVAQGKILAIGDSFPFNTTSMKGARVLPDGTMDTGFGPNADGTLTLSFCNCTASSYGRTVLREVTGRVVMIGNGDKGGGAPDDIAVAVLKDDGSLANQFSKNLIDVGGNAEDLVGGAILSKDGRAVIAVANAGLLGVVKLQESFEILDPDFGTSGFAQFPPGMMGEPRDLALEPVSGDFVMLGATGATLQDLVVARLTAASAPANFGSGDQGFVVLNGAPALEARSIAIDSKGRIVVAATTTQLGDKDVMVGRLLPDGTPDASFGTEGIAILERAGDDRVADMVVLADDRVVVGGMSGMGFNDQQPFLTRFLADGTPDVTFGNGGLVEIDLGTQASLESLGAAKDGELFIGGTRESQPTKDFVAKVWQ